MSQFNQQDDEMFEIELGLDDLELKLLECSENYQYNQAERMGRLLLNPEYLNIWVNAKPNTLH